MKTFYELEGLQVKLDQGSVLRSIDCYEDSPIYEDIAEEYQAICRDMQALAVPVGVIGFGTMPESIATKEYKQGTPIAYAILSIGDAISRCSTRSFQEGEYVRGMLCDAIADEALFSLEESMIARLKEACKEQKMGVLKRLEAPHDIPMSAQREAWKYLNLEERFGIGITSGDMYDPVKTTCQIFVLTEDTDLFCAEHDCSNCPNSKCNRRKC